MKPLSRNPIANKTLASQPGWPGGRSHVGTTSNRVEMWNESPEGRIVALETKAKSGPQEEKNPEIDQKSDGIRQQVAREHDMGKVESHRAGETTAARRWSLTHEMQGVPRVWRMRLENDGRYQRR